MRKINYPLDRPEFEKTYQDALLSEVNRDEINCYLKHIPFKGEALSIEKLIVLPFTDLVDLMPICVRYWRSQTKYDRTLLNALLDYDSRQRIIAEFLSNQEMDLTTCFYCNMDYVYAFKGMADYSDWKDFLSRAEKHELLLITGLGEVAAENIIKRQTSGSITDTKGLGLTKPVEKLIKEFQFTNTHSHFTLDHALPKAKMPFFGLCLYNLIPSCSACNSKFKSIREFDVDDSLKYIVPSSDEYRLSENLEFIILYPKNVDDINSEIAFTLSIAVGTHEKQVRRYLQMFQLNGRYVYQKKELYKLIKTSQERPETKIKEMAELLGLSKLEVRRMVFGAELFDKESSSLPLVKLKRDIGRCLKIEGVLKP